MYLKNSLLALDFVTKKSHDLINESGCGEVS
jgi:hypothetical protein